MRERKVVSDPILLSQFSVHTNDNFYGIFYLIFKILRVDDLLKHVVGASILSGAKVMPVLDALVELRAVIAYTQARPVGLVLDNRQDNVVSQGINSY